MRIQFFLRVIEYCISSNTVFMFIEKYNLHKYNKLLRCGHCSTREFKQLWCFFYGSIHVKLVFSSRNSHKKRREILWRQNNNCHCFVLKGGKVGLAFLGALLIQFLISLCSTRLCSISVFGLVKRVFV